MKQSLFKTSYLLLLLSVVLISYGTYRKANAPNLSEYEQYSIDKILEQHPNEDLGPGPGLGVILSSFWLFVGVIQSMACVVFIIFCEFLRTLILRNILKPISILLNVLFILLCSIAIYCYLNSAVVCFLWHFFILGIGEIIFAVGIMIGSIGILREKPYPSFKQIANAPA